MTRLPSCSTRCGDLLPSVCYTGYVSTEAFPASPSREPLGSVKIRGGRLKIETTHFGVHNDLSPVHILSEAQALEKRPKRLPAGTGDVGKHWTDLAGHSAAQPFLHSRLLGRQTDTGPSWCMRPSLS